MGLLDDAIREHLDLRLRRGADAAEVARQEQEALGPVRREPDPSPEPVALGGEEDLEPPTRIVPPSDDAYADDGYEYDDDEHEEDESPAAAVPAHGPGGSVPALGETEEWGFEDAGEEDEAPAEGEGEDVLEQTPEFLSETPEHDRLWFEQKPPRDFDFDG